MLTMNIGCFKTARVAIPWEIKPNLPPIGIELLFGPIRNNYRSWKFSFFFPCVLVNNCAMPSFPKDIWRYREGMVYFSVQHPRKTPLKMA